MVTLNIPCGGSSVNIPVHHYNQEVNDVKAATYHRKRTKGHEHPFRLRIEMREWVTSDSAREECHNRDPSEERIRADARIQRWTSSALKGL